MTALAQYQRLEATALWRETPDGQRREVLVSLGDATLVISALNDRPIAHWSLPAVQRLNPRQRPAIYAPDSDADETVEIADPEMIRAIETLRGAIEQARPHPGRLRFGLLSLTCAAVLALSIFWLPGALMRQTANVLPEATRAELGRDLLTRMAGLSGRPCNDPSALQALSRLSGRVLGREPLTRIVVLPEVVAGSAHLPGQIIVIDRGLVENFDVPEVLAGFLLAEDTRRLQSDPVLDLLRDAGLVATLRLLTTGRVAEGALHDRATRLLSEEKPAIPDETLLAAFARAGIPSEPYAYALDISGETTLGLIEADPMRGQSTQPLLDDQDWIALQGICTG